MRPIESKERSSMRQLQNLPRHRRFHRNRPTCFAKIGAIQVGRHRRCRRLNEVLQLPRYVYAWTQHHLASFIKIAADKATTMGHITRDHLDDALVWIPDLLTMNQLGDLLSSVYDLLISCRLENRSLSSMRDTLLPKLMSGEIDVEKVEV